jgi:chorismate mutase
LKALKAIRAATSVPKDTAQEIRKACVELMDSVFLNNNLIPQNIISILFTLTPDLKSLNPATAVRQQMGLNEVAMLCAQEAFIEGGLPHCIRALIHIELEEGKAIQHVYLNEARALRADWSGGTA